MKKHYPVLIALSVIGQSLGQTPTPPIVVKETIVESNVVAPGVPREVVVEETVTKDVVPLNPAEVQVAPAVTIAPQVRVLDPMIARRQLSMLPRELPPGATPAPGTTVEETTTTVEIPGQPTRIYNVERNVVIVEGRELPYLTIPVLFVKESAELLDNESRLAIEETAKAINETLQTSSTATFDIEGHTSTDGEAEMNLNLSAMRAQRIYDELTKRYLVPATALTAHGHGENYPTYPSGTEAEMMLDRRVLVVRVK